MDGNFDLFGMPVPDGFGKRGRPEHRVTLESTCPSSNDLRLFGLLKNGVSGSVFWLI